jgi:copper homeostasis protein
MDDKGIVLEVCVDSIESALAAERGGAHRVELCSNLLDGGLTPSSGLIVTVRERISMALHVMIRPRGGDFCYCDDEFEVMKRDVCAAKQVGANGVALGILDSDGRVDLQRTRQLVELAAPLRVTFHRAFDMSRDLLRSLADLQMTRVHSVLTSGGAQTAAEGAEMLNRLVEASRLTGIGIVAASGIEDHNVTALIERTGVREIHASLRHPVASPMRHQNKKVSMGSVKGQEYRRLVVDEDKVRRLLQAASKAAR